MRSVLGLCAAAWFLGAALIMGDGSAGPSGDPLNQGAAGDPAVMAIYLAARILFVGLGALSLGVVRWSEVGTWLRRITAPGGGH